MDDRSQGSGSERPVVGDWDGDRSTLTGFLHYYMTALAPDLSESMLR